MPSPALGVALRALTAGFHLFPCKPGTKHPATRDGFHNGSNDRDVVSGFFDTKAIYNIGVWAGASNLVILDLDQTKNPDELPYNGATYLLDRAEQSGTDPAQVTADIDSTFKVATPRGGLHAYFRHAKAMDISPSTGTATKGVAPNVDIRAGGSYAVLWGRIPEGAYTYEGRLEDIRPLPGWLHRMILASGTPKEPEVPAWVTDTLRVIRPGGDSKEARYAGGALVNAARRVQHAQPGGRNDALNRETHSLARFVHSGVLDRAEVEQVMTAAGMTTGLSPTEVQRTLRSALRGGA